MYKYAVYLTFGGIKILKALKIGCNIVTFIVSG